VVLVEQVFLLVAVEVQQLLAPQPMQQAALVVED
jgi:hypothetical protein